VRVVERVFAVVVMVVVLPWQPVCAPAARHVKGYAEL